MSSKDYIKVMTPVNLIGAFQKAELYPFNRDSVSNFQLAPSQLYYPAPETEMATETNRDIGRNQDDIQEQDINTNADREETAVNEERHRIDPVSNTYKKTKQQQE